MKKLVRLITTALYSLSIIAGTAALVPVRVVADNGEDHSQVAAAEDNKDDKKEENKEEAKPAAQAKSAVYKYVAQPGDCYTLMARKAIQTYGIKNKVKLSQAKIIAAETWLTQAAGSPQLNIGQAVDMQESTVKQYVEKAQKLSATDEAAWAAYTAGVDFNTNAVGQAR